MVWLLSRVEDVHGNYYTVEYQEDDADGDYYPVKIAYTKHSANSSLKLHTIEFSYEARTDATVLYLPGRFKMDQRLKWITVKTDGNLLRKYRLDYDYGASTQRSRLIGVQEYGSDGNWPAYPLVEIGYAATGNTLPATTLEWSAPQTSGSVGGFNIPMKTSVEYIDFGSGYPTAVTTYLPNSLVKGDVNGDGLSDIVVWTPGHNEFLIYILKADGTSNSPITFIVNSAYANIYSNATQQWLADVNGDGRADLVSWRWGTGLFYICRGKADGSFENPINYTPNDQSICRGDAKHWLMDMNGDGRTDIVTCVSTMLCCYVSLGKEDGSFENPKSSSLLNGFKPGLQPEFGPLISNAQQQWLADINGDGWADFTILISERGIYIIYKGRSDGYFDSVEIFQPDVVWVGGGQHWMGDVNGDGKADLVTYVTGTPAMYLFVNYGLGTRKFSTTQEIYNPEFAGYNNPDCQHTVADVNGDGRVDFISWYQGAVVFANMSTGNGFSNRIQIGGFPDSDVDIFDINGDGASEIMSANKTDSSTIIKYFQHQDKLHDLLTTIHNPLGGSATVTYTPAAQEPGAINSAGKTYPYIANTRPRQLVTKIKFDDGMGGVESLSAVSFKYQDGMTKAGLPHERKGLGCLTFTREDDNTKIKTVTTFKQPASPADEPFAGLVEKVQSFDGLGSISTETIYQYGFRVDNATYPSVKFIYKTGQTSKNYDGNTNRLLTN